MRLSYTEVVKGCLKLHSLRVVRCFDATINSTIPSDTFQCLYPYYVLGGTAALWFTYYRLCTGLDMQEEHRIPLLYIAVDARTAFLVYSIVASILTVSGNRYTLLSANIITTRH